MNSDDIVFDEVRYREPKRARRPDRDRRWACLAYEVPGVGDLPIFLDRRPADAIERHALRDTSVELGGILLGNECVDDVTGEPFVWVTESLEAKHYENTQASFTYTHDAWEEITRERDRLHPDLDIVGWYHTHPDFGIFLSSHDLFIHRNFFDQPLQVAYVVDPIRQTRGFFRWRDGGLDQVGGYYLTGDRNDRVALARLVNDLESVPNADAGSGVGGLSPRLEAELIAMLSRPHQAPASSAADRAQSAAIFGSLGLILGMVLLAGAGWVYLLGQQVRAQTEALDRLRVSVDRGEIITRSTVDLALRRAGDGRKADDLLDAFAKAQQEVSASAADLDRERRISRIATAELGNLEKQVSELSASKVEADKKAQSDKETIDRQKDDLAKLRKENDEMAKTPPGDALRNYTTAWYAALVGWVVAAIALLGLVGLWAARTPPEDDDMPSPGPITVPVPPRPPAEPPHQIS